MAVLPLENEKSKHPFSIKEARLSRDKHRMLILLEEEDVPSENSRTQIAIVDISDPLQPQQQAILALDSPGVQFALSPDGRHATLLIPTVSTPRTSEINFELIKLDLSAPASPEIISREPITTREIWLSPDNTFYAMAQFRESQNERLWVVTWLDGSRTETLQDGIYGGQILSSSTSRYLAINAFDKLVVWDLHESPPLKFTRDIGTSALDLNPRNKNCILAISEKGYLLGQDTLTQRNYSYRIEDNWPREPVLPQQTFYCAGDYGFHPSPEPARKLIRRSVVGRPDELYVFSSPLGQFSIIELNNPSQPVIRKSGWMPDAKSRWLAQIDDYTVTADGQTLKIYSVDTLATPEIDWKALEKAHQQHFMEPSAALTLQKNTMSSKEHWLAMYFVIKNARPRLEEHNVIQAIAAPLNGFPAANAAKILSDYASFLGDYYIRNGDDNYPLIEVAPFNWTERCRI